MGDDGCEGEFLLVYPEEEQIARAVMHADIRQHREKRSDIDKRNTHAKLISQIWLAKVKASNQI